MSTPQQLFQAGRLDEAVASLGSVLRTDPGDVRARTFLFELLLFSGALDRAEKQLDILADQSQEAGMGALLYRSALHGERERQAMFRSGAFPTTPAPPVSGTLNGERFESISDPDPRIGARLEIIAAGQYTWVPMAHVAELAVEAPVQLRDLFWARARIKAGPGLRDFEFGEVVAPALAALTADHPDDPVRLGREIDWVELPGGGEAPVGAKVLEVDGTLVPLLEIRELLVDPPDDPPPS